VLYRSVSHFILDVASEHSSNQLPQHRLVTHTGLKCKSKNYYHSVYKPYGNGRTQQFRKCMCNMKLRCVWIFVSWTLLWWSYHFIHWGSQFLLLFIIVDMLYMIVIYLTTVCCNSLIVLLTHSADGPQVRPSWGSSYKWLLSDKDLWIISTIIMFFIICFYMYLKYLLFIRLRCFETRSQNCEKQLLASSFLVNNQLDAQFFFRMYLFQFSKCFEHTYAHHQENQLC
jgi:hypothetical protein